MDVNTKHYQITGTKSTTCKHKSYDACLHWQMQHPLPELLLTAECSKRAFEFPLPVTGGISDPAPKIVAKEV